MYPIYSVYLYPLGMYIIIMATSLSADSNILYRQVHVKQVLQNS